MSKLKKWQNVKQKTPHNRGVLIFFRVRNPPVGQSGVVGRCQIPEDKKPKERKEKKRTYPLHWFKSRFCLEENERSNNKQKHARKHDTENIFPFN